MREGETKHPLAGCRDPGQGRWPALGGGRFAALILMLPPCVKSGWPPSSINCKPVGHPESSLEELHCLPQNGVDCPKDVPAGDMKCLSRPRVPARWLLEPCGAGARARWRSHTRVLRPIMMPAQSLPFDHIVRPRRRAALVRVNSAVEFVKGGKARQLRVEFGLHCLGRTFYNGRQRNRARSGGIRLSTAHCKKIDRSFRRVVSGATVGSVRGLRFGWGVALQVSPFMILLY